MQVMRTVRCMAVSAAPVDRILDIVKTLPFRNFVCGNKNTSTLNYNEYRGKWEEKQLQ